MEVADNRQCLTLPRLPITLVKDGLSPWSPIETARAANGSFVAVTTLHQIRTFCR